MPRIGRIISIVAGLAAATAGTFLLMGSLRTGPTQTVRLEQARIEALGRLWESRLEAARGTFRDQLVRNGVIAALDFPGDWSDWRVRNKLQSVFSSWPKELGSLKALGLLDAAGVVHTAMGDTAGLNEAILATNHTDNVELAFLRKAADHPELVALQYRPMSTNSGPEPGRVVGIVTAAGLFTADNDPSQRWTLLATPDQPVLSSDQRPETPVSSTTWALLISEGSGAVKQSSGTVCFTRVRIIGMTPLLLVHTVRTSAAAGWIALLLILGGAAAVAAAGFLNRKPTTASTVSEPKRSADPAPVSDTSNFRQIFQAIEDPLLVVDQSGLVIRANSSAQDWLKLQKGKPSDKISARIGGDDWPIAELLIRAASDPNTVCGNCRLSLEDSIQTGVLRTTRLSRDEDGKGSVLLHFHPQPQMTDERSYMPPVFVPAAADACPEPDCPYPVIAVSEDGLITGYNEAARAACPRLENTPILSDILPELSNRDWPDILSADPGTTFESLFGSSACEFTLIHSNGRILLYGHRLADSKRLEVEMKQAQENFYALCALCPVPVLLVDPRDHAVLEANSGAADLFGVTPADLRGQIFGSLSAEPWELGSGEDIFTAATAQGHFIRCWLRYELIKIEGAPTLLMLLEPIPEIYTIAPTESLTDEASAPRPEAAVIPPMPVGPGLLITMNPTVREVARRLLEKVGHPCESFSCLDDATVWLITHDQRPELTAIDLSDFDGAENWIEEMRARCGDVPCVAFTDSEGYTLPNGGLNEFLAKPFDLNSLTDALKALHLEAELCESLDSDYDVNEPES
jgi:PAS domain-containing protein